MLQFVDYFSSELSRYNFGWSHGKEKLESGKPGKLLYILYTSFHTV